MKINNDYVGVAGDLPNTTTITIPLVGSRWRFPHGGFPGSIATVEDVCLTTVTYRLDTDKVLRFCLLPTFFSLSEPYKEPKIYPVGQWFRANDGRFWRLTDICYGVSIVSDSGESLVTWEELAKLTPCEQPVLAGDEFLPKDDSLNKTKATVTKTVNGTIYYDVVVPNSSTTESFLRFYKRK